MSAPRQRTSEPNGGRSGAASFVSTPNAERYLLESDNLRRRQLRSSLLHGSSRIWRERVRIWPAVIGGIVVLALIIAAIAVYGAFQRQKKVDQKNNPVPTVTTTVTGSPTPSTRSS